MDRSEVVELLFFDTFSHGSSEEINLDLVQFPKPVIISEIRIIPLGARVQADFPGGVRLGATNPTQFIIEFFVNDLSKHGASTFEKLGTLEYQQSSDIQFECSQKSAPTDGLVLRGWYTTITLAVYGSLSKGVLSPPPDPRGGELSTRAATSEWVQSQQNAVYMESGYNYPAMPYGPSASEHEYVGNWPSVAAPPPAAPLVHNEPYESKNYSTPPNWESPRDESNSWPGPKKDAKSVSPIRSDKGRHRNDYWDERDDRKDRRRRDEDKRYKDGGGKDDDRRRDRDWREPGGRMVKTDTSWERDREKSPYSESGSYRRRPKSPPSPRRPYTPTEHFWSPERTVNRYGDDRRPSSRNITPPMSKSRVIDQLRVEVTGSPQTPLQSPADVAKPALEDHSLDEEQFEPILSDEEIVDENDSQQYADLDYDTADDLDDVVKTFSPFTFEVQPLENLLDPALSQYEAIRSEARSIALKQLEQIVTSVELEAKEEWVAAAEHVLNVLCFIPLGSETASILLKWVDFGLDFNEALNHPTPGVKLRHIKAGVRLAEALCQSGLCVELVRSGLHQKLIRLFHCEHMALSIRLLILGALDATLLDEEAMTYFLNEQWECEISGENEEGGTYKHILRVLASPLQVRLKFTLKSLLEKVHTYELLSQLHKLTEKCVTDDTFDDAEVVKCIQAVHRVFDDSGVILGMPSRFLPVLSQFEVKIDGKSPMLFLYRHFRIHKLLESILIFLTNRKSSPALIGALFDLLKSIADTHHGLVFLSMSPVVTSSILKAIQGAEESSEQISFSAELPTRLFIIQCLDKLHKLPDEDTAFSVLHDLFCLSLGQSGKSQIAFVLSLDDNLQNLLALCETFGAKSVARLYICDIAAITVRYSSKVEYLRKVSKVLIENASIENQSKLSEVLPYFQSMDLIFDDVTGLCEILKKHTPTDACSSVSEEAVTAVRCLVQLCIPPHANLPYNLGDDCANFIELRYKHAALQLYSLDGMTHITAILTKLLEYYEQPVVHSSHFINTNGYTIISFVESAVLLMRRMLTYLIEARGSDYKDLTHVNVLVDVYALMQAVPANAEGCPIAKSVCYHVVETLLVYTQPPAQGDAYGKSLWTLMLSDVLKFVMKAPYCFVPGFSLLSELLPLPLPVHTRATPDPSEVTALVSSRQLWSAHVHPLAGTLHDMIAALACGSFVPMLQLVRRVAVQLVDLAAPTALIIARAVLDPLLAALGRADGGWDLPASPHTARLLHFLVCLIPHHSFKVAVLSLVTPGANVRTDERLVTLIDAWCSILRTPGTTPSHMQAQECVVVLLQTLLDPEISLVPTNSVLAGLSNCLPTRDILVSIIGALLDHISSAEHPLHFLLLAFKPLIQLTDHDYGFYHLRASLETRPDAIWNVLSRLSEELSKKNTDALNAVFGTLALLREFVLDAPTSLRTLTMSSAELARVLRWGHTVDGGEHPLINIHSLLKEWSTADQTVNTLCDSSGDLVKMLSSTDQDKASMASKGDEPVIPAAMSLMDQFSARTIFVPGEPALKTLSSSYWLSLSSFDDVEQDSDQIQCDLLELSRSILPDLHLPHEVLKVCRLKPSDDDEDGKKPENIKYQLSGTRTRMPFVTPMRGRGGRQAPQRGDLFRSRPPNTSRPPSLHVDDFVALETCGQQPTGPTGYNKVSVRNVKEVIATRGRGRGRGFGSAPYPRRDSPRNNSRGGRGGWIHEELRLQSTTRFRPWPTEDLRRIHPFPR